MPSNEVYPNPTVTNVIFQIRFPNLFSIENKIGDYQITVMEKFPKSALLFRRQVVFADVGPQVKFEEFPNEMTQQGPKIWQFVSPDKVTLNVLSDSLDINSAFHKTYNNPGHENRFRDTIQFAVDNFLKITKIPVLNRIGLRYIDDCPIPAKDNKSFGDYYNTTFDIERFNFANASEMEFKTVVKRDEYFLRYAESFAEIDGKRKYILDFDAFANDINASDYLKTTDKLHDIIIDEYQKTIKDPVRDYMRKPKDMTGGTA
ncbi:MAG: TIGR04255 family protein [candidate division Zixibacteria bacterium]|nr:TIGR04255 family protein [candidate division Zixibacteria bacterium]